MDSNALDDEVWRATQDGPKVPSSDEMWAELDPAPYSDAMPPKDSASYSDAMPPKLDDDAPPPSYSSVLLFDNDKDKGFW